MFCEFTQCFNGFDVPIRNRQVLVACGYDQNCYISTAKLASSPYVTQDLIQAKLGGLIKLIEACDDSVPPSGDFNDTAIQSVYNMVIQSVVTEINSYLSTIYPIPLAQTGTVCVIKVTDVDSDGAVTAIEVIHGGNYLTAATSGYGDDLIPDGAMFSGIGNYNLSGLTAGASYLFTPGANETGFFLNGSDMLEGEQVFVAAGTIITIYGNDADLEVTAQVQPQVPNVPAYLRYIDPIANVDCFGANWLQCQTGTGLTVFAAFTDSPYSDENGTTINAQTVAIAPAIVDGGTGYQVNDLLVLTGGTSFVPAKIREAALDLICHTLYKRRLAPDEKNPFSTLAAMWRKLLLEIGHGEQELDGTYKRFFSVGAMWGTRSVCNASSL